MDGCSRGVGGFGRKSYISAEMFDANPALLPSIHYSKVRPKQRPLLTSTIVDGHFKFVLHFPCARSLNSHVRARQTMGISPADTLC